MIKQKYKYTRVYSLIFLFLSSYCQALEYEIEFQNKYYGVSVMTPVRGVTKLTEVLQNKDIMLHTSIGDKEDKTCSPERLFNIHEQFESNLRKYLLGFYEAYTSDHTFLGVAGFFVDKEKDGSISPEICCYLLQEHQGRKVGSDIISSLTAYAFQVSNCPKVIGDAFETSLSTKVFTRLGYVRRNHQYPSEDKKHAGQIRYKLSRQQYLKKGLFELSQVILRDPKKFIPSIYTVATDNMERVRALWFGNFSKGVPLCNGGSDKSFLHLEDLDKTNLHDFHGYRSDRTSSRYLSELEMKNFLMEEDVITDSTILPELRVAFCLGSHEGIMRLARCLHHPKLNDGILCPLGAYGFTSCGLATMKPTPYKIYLTDTQEGDKIDIGKLEHSITAHPRAKTLLFELKTIAGAVYTQEEIKAIIALCKLKGLFLIADITHAGMEFHEHSAFPDITTLCLQQDYHQFGVIYTGSKIYGLERARVGFLVLSEKNIIPNLYSMYTKDLYRVSGSVGDLPFEAAHTLFNVPVKERKSYKRDNSKKYRFNMNLMLAYIEGIHSPRIDADLHQDINSELPLPYAQGIKGLHVDHKPQSGTHMKIDVSFLRNMHFSNVPMNNAEIFSYALNKTYGIATLHAFQIMDVSGTTLRLCFGDKGHVHRGMRAISNFVNLLTNMPSENEFMPGIRNVWEIIYPSAEKMDEVIRISREPVSKLELLLRYRQNVKSLALSYISLSRSQIDQALHKAASRIQTAWKDHIKNKKGLLKTLQ